MQVDSGDLFNKASKAAQVLNFGCANRKVLLEKEITTVPPSLRLLLNHPTAEGLADTEALLYHILGKKEVLDEILAAQTDAKTEYSALARSADELCSVSSSLITPLTYSKQ